MYSNTRVLIVDDNPSIRDDYRRILCPSTSGLEELEQIEAVLFDEMRNHQSKLRPNFQTAFASQGEQAESLAKAAIEQGVPFAVAIVDVRMPPGMDGVETVKRLWQVQSDMQIILCTAYSDYSWQEIVEQLGASHRLVVLKKPFDPIEVLQLCQAMCIKWVAEREMACRQIDLQSRLMRTSLRAEKMAGELYQERGFRAELNQKRSDAEIIDVMSGLASSIAHDFNNALTVIQGHLSSALLTPSGLVATLPMEQMLEAAERASLLSRQMMALTSEVETPSDMHVFNALPVITKQIEMMGRVLKEKAHIDLYYSDSEHFIYASESLLTRLLNLMVIRAQEQMSRGGNLSITLIRQSSLDTPGGAHQMMAHVSFEMAPRADASKAHQELSESMMAALKLSESLGGKLLINVGANLACVISLSLPEADPSQPQEAMQRIVAARNIVSSIDKQLTFMVVDDERSICDILGYILGSQGHKVLKAQTAMEAWTLWQSNRDGIDMVISDIYLPDGLTGYDLAGYLRASAPDLPIIYMSGYQPSMISGGEELTVGVNYLTKPFDVLDLLNVVTRTLETGRQMTNPPSKPLHASALATNTGSISNTAHTRITSLQHSR
jgi:two-component system NtrC family sensor kinase